MAIPIGLLVVILVAHLLITKENFYLSAMSLDKRYVAQIVWNRTFPYVQGVDAYLVVKDVKENRIRFKRLLLRNRDEFADIETEFKGISWRDKEVVLHHEPNHYRGPVTFVVENNK
jgi:hypothetical protein